MTAVLIILMALAIGGTIGVCWSFFGPPARDDHPPVYPACVSLELADRPLRQAWDSLDVYEQADLLRMHGDEIRESLSLIAWLVDLGTESVHAELAAVGDSWGMSYG